MSFSKCLFLHSMIKYLVETHFRTGMNLTEDIFFSFAQNKSSLLIFFMKQKIFLFIQIRNKCLKTLHYLTKIEDLTLFEKRSNA